MGKMITMVSIFHSLLLLWFATGAAAHDVEDDATSLLRIAPLVAQAASGDGNMVCVVVRTYWAHGADGRGSLVHLLKSLQRQKHTRWQALLVVMDSRPFEDLSHIVRSLDDPRIWVFADWVSPELTPKTPQGHWTKFYHNRLYNITDEAARACPPDSRWVVFTNGDNMYHEDAFAYLDKSTADVVAWDFYSRYQRPTGVPCNRFQAEQLAPPCKVNRMKFCHSDLGAVAYSWPRLIQEDRRFGALDRGGEFTGQDGIMTEAITHAGWKLDHAAGLCLYDQGPSPHTCLRSGGVWDERSAGKPEDFGGHCISKEAARVALADPSVQAVEVTLSSDGNVRGFTGGDEEPNLVITCIRPRANFRHMLAAVFGAICQEDIDKPILAELTAERQHHAAHAQQHPLKQNAREPVKDKKLEWFKQHYRKPHAPVPKFPDTHATSKRARMTDSDAAEPQKDEL